MELSIVGIGILIGHFPFRANPMLVGQEIMAAHI